MCYTSDYSISNFMSIYNINVFKWYLYMENLLESFKAYYV